MTRKLPTEVTTQLELAEMFREIYLKLSGKALNKQYTHRAIGMFLEELGRVAMDKRVLLRNLGSIFVKRKKGRYKHFHTGEVVEYDVNKCFFVPTVAYKKRLNPEIGDDMEEIEDYGF